MTPAKNGTNVTTGQRQMMLNVEGQINKGSNYVMKDKKYPYPYVYDFQTGVVYPAKMLLNWDTMHKKR